MLIFVLIGRRSACYTDGKQFVTMLRRKTVNLKEQQYVSKLAETGSLTKAAEQLYITQPALSLYIRNLEKNLGVDLFCRKGKRLTLTPAGELYLDKARQMLELRDRFLQELNELMQGRNLRLSIGMQSIRAPHLSARLIQHITKTYPDVRLQWYDEVYSSLETLLLNGQIDLFFCNRSRLRTDFEYIPLYEDEVVFMVNSEHPLLKYASASGGGEPAWIDLSLFENELFLLNTPMQSLRHYTEQILFETHVKPRNTFILRSINTIISLVNQGNGVGFICRQYLNNAPELDHVSIFRVGIRKHSVPFCAIHKKDVPLSSIAEEAVQWLLEYMQTITPNSPSLLPSGDQRLMR